MVKTAVLVSGGGTNLQAILDAKAAGKLPHAEISLVVASRPDAYALVRAEKAGVLCAVLRKGKEKPIEQYGRELLELLHSHGIELVVLAGFLTILPENVIQAYPKRILNIHPSLIPSFCGAGFYGLKVHEAALARGVKVTGATVHFVDDGTDTGPILLQKSVDVQPDDTPKSLQQRVMEEAEWIILPKAIDLIAAGRVEVVDGKAVIR